MLRVFMGEKRSTGIKADSVGRTACPQCGSVVDASQVPAFTTVQCPQCGAAFAAPGKLGPFILLRELGSGEMGVTYRAFEKALGRYVAIKVMHRSLAKDPKRVKDFLAEGRALASLDHPNAVRVFSLGKEKGQPYIAVELVEGRPLSRSLGRGRTMPEGDALKIATEVAAALSAADRIGLVHGDVKPDNIVLNAKGAAKLVDFGLARFGGSNVASDAAVGAPYYVSPEQVARSSVDRRTDIYSLGATLFHALAGVPPFPGTVLAEVLNARLKRAAPNLMGLRQGLHLATAGLVARMLERDPARRHQTYGDLLADLRNACRAAGVKLSPELEAPEAPSADRKVAFQREKASRGLLVAVVLGIACLLCVGAWAVFFRGGKVAPPGVWGDRVATPVLWPAARKISRTIKVTVTCEKDDAEIRYTVHGHKPNRMSPLFKGPIRVAPGMTLRVRAFHEGLKPSEVVTAVYGCDSSVVAEVVKIRTDARAAWDKVKAYDPAQGIGERLERGRHMLAQADGQFDRDAYPAAKASYRKLLALSRQIEALKKARN